MLKKFFPSLNKGVSKLKSHQKLWYTIFVAVLILISFVFVANQFVSIAQDAQDRLVNVRLGSMQDSFVQFAPDYLVTDSEVLRDRIRRIAFADQTIREFKVVEFNSNGDPVVVASLLKKDIGSVDAEHDFNYTVASNDPNSSFTIETIEDGERVYTTTRLIVDEYDRQIGAVLTKQSLSAADIKISNSIQNSVLIFIFIVILIMFLFFKHARSIDYLALYQKLSEVDRLKDDFISMASHELLTLIRGYVEELSEIKRMPKASKQAIERIDLVTNRLDELVNEMLDVSRIEQGRMKFEMQKSNPVPLIEEVVEEYKMPASEKKLKLSFANSLQGGAVVSFDENRLRQVLVNLIGNAIKYTPKGAVEVEVKEVDRKLQIRVSDSGIGMTAEQQQKLFQRFSRVQTEETAEIRGTGLGLWITKQIVEKMKGKIWAESIKDVGTHFVVEFPVEG
jgi:signal transduction histidine kinase